MSFGLADPRPGVTYSDFSSSNSEINTSDMDTNLVDDDDQFSMDEEENYPPLILNLTVEDGIWIATDRITGVASQGEDENEAIRNLTEAVEAYNGEGRSPSDDELREIGIDPNENVSSESITEPFE